MLLLLVLETVPEFVGLDEKVWRLQKGDLVSVNPGLNFKLAKLRNDRWRQRSVLRQTLEGCK